VYIKYVIKLI